MNIEGGNAWLAGNPLDRHRALSQVHNLFLPELGGFLLDHSQFRVNRSVEVGYLLFLSYAPLRGGQAEDFRKRGGQVCRRRRSSRAHGNTKATKGNLEAEDLFEREGEHCALLELDGLTKLEYRLMRLSHGQRNAPANAEIA